MTKKERRLFKIYVFGNPLLKEDSLPLILLPKLKEKFKNIKFIELDSTENLPEEKNLVIIDTIINASKVVILKDLDKINFEKRCSLHDCDLGFNLKLMKKMGKIRDVTIIGVPPSIKEKIALKEISEIISSLLLRSD